MRADYDPEADSIAIELEPVERLDHGEQLAEGTVAHYANGRIVAIDVLDASKRLTQKLAEAAIRYGLDIEVLEGISRTALANPDQTVILEILPAAQEAA